MEGEIVISAALILGASQGWEDVGRFPLVPVIGPQSHLLCMSVSYLDSVDWALRGPVGSLIC